MVPFLSINHFLFKLVLAPIIITVATLVARQWGERIGGLIVGLPLTSAPVSIFFALEQGRSFASDAAKGAIAGLIAVAMFCMAYAYISRRCSWVPSAITGTGIYLLSIWFISKVTLNLVEIVILVVLVLSIALLFINPNDNLAVPFKSPKWDIPLRMVVASGLLILITTVANTLGPKWSGLLSPFPIFTFVMVTFSHSQTGSQSAQKVIKGVLAGLFSYVAFFIIVSLLVMRMDLWIVYMAAAIAAISVNGTILLLMLYKSRTSPLHNQRTSPRY